VDRHRPIHGVCTWAHPAPRQRIGSPQNHAAINAANAFSHADGIDLFRHVGLVPRGQAGLHGAGLASLWLDRRGARSGHVDDNTGARFLDAGQRIRLYGIAESQSKYEKDRCLDAAIFLCCRHARNNAGGYHCRYDSVSSRHLNLHHRKPPGRSLERKSSLRLRFFFLYRCAAVPEERRRLMKIGTLSVFCSA